MKESIQPFRKNWISISIVVTILCFLIVFIVVRPQQHNIYELDRKIEVVNEKIEHIKSIEEKITLEKDILIIEKDKVTINNGMYAALLQALGPMVLGITAYVGYLNFTIGEKNLKVTEDKQVTERFSKAIEHLGSDKIDIRLGGIYTLEKIAISSPEYHWTIVEILSAFIREKCQIERSMINSNNSETGEIITTEENPFSINSQNSSNQIKKIAVDIQAAITVLGRRNVDLEDSEEQYINLMEVNLAGVNMNNSNFSHANFIGSDLSGATLWNARLISCHLDRANLYQARLTYADLSKASLSGYPDATRTILFTGLSGYPDATRTILFTDLSEANLTGANLSEADLSGANLSFTFLHGTNFSRAILNQVNLHRSCLSGIKFNNTPLDGANFTDANISSTVLDDVIFHDANLNNTNLDDTSLYGADLSNSKNITRNQLRSARTDGNTQLPDYL